MQGLLDLGYFEKDKDSEDEAKGKMLGEHDIRTYCDAMLVLESGAESVFGWLPVASGRKSIKNGGKRAKKKRGRGDKSKMWNEFEELSRVYCPATHCWSSPLHYICVHEFPGVGADELFEALYNFDSRAKWDSAWREGSRYLGKCADGASDLVYSSFANENRFLRALGVNFDFVDRRFVFRNACYPDAKDRFLSAKAVALSASRKDEKDCVVDKKKKEEGPADFVVLLCPSEHPGAPKRHNFDRCVSIPPSGYIIRRSANGVLLTVVSRSSIRLPLDGAVVSRDRVHRATVKQFARWRWQLSQALYNKKTNVLN